MVRLLVTTAIVLAVAGSVRAEEWYLPRRTHILKSGSLEVGTRSQFLFDRNGIEFDRRVDQVLSVRYAPTRRLEFYVEGPYSYIEQERVVFPSLLHSTSQEGWGDVFGQVSYDWLGREDWKLMFSADLVAPTGKNAYEHRRNLGDGFYKVSPGLTYVKVLDPAALFFYLGHQWTIPRSFRNVGKVEPGEDLRFRAGMSLLLHPRFRASVFTAGDILGHTRVRSIQAAGTDADVIRFGGGMNWSITDRWKLDANGVFAATSNASDAVLSLGLTWAVR